jgi:hypothetical protein
MFLYIYIYIYIYTYKCIYGCYRYVYINIYTCIFIHICVYVCIFYMQKIPYLYSSHNYFIPYIYLHIKNCHVWIIYVCEIVWYIFILVNNRDETRSIFLVQVHWYSQVLRLRTKTERRLRLDFILFYLLLYVYVCLYIFFFIIHTIWSII